MVDLLKGSEREKVWIREIQRWVDLGVSETCMPHGRTPGAFRGERGSLDLGSLRHTSSPIPYLAMETKSIRHLWDHGRPDPWRLSRNPQDCCTMNEGACPMLWLSMPPQTLRPPSVSQCP